MRTEFYCGAPTHDKIQWYWRTVADNGQTVAVGGEGYDDKRGAVNGWLSSEGNSAWGTNLSKGSLADDLPEGYVLNKIDDYNFTITKTIEEK